MSRSTSIFGRPTSTNKVSLFRQKYQPIIPKIVQISSYTGEISKNDASTEAYNEYDITIPEDIISSLDIINTKYISNLASKKYESIPKEFNNYLQLYNIVNTFANETPNNNFKTFLNITLGSLKGAVEVYSLFNQNIDLTNNNNILTNKMNEVLRGENIHRPISNVTGKLSMQKSFTISPLFSYYIATYGMPEYGAGFDPDKLSNILNILNENGIDPYKIG